MSPAGRSVTMHAAIAEEAAPDKPETCSVVALYDDALTRARALSACDYLVSQLWEEVEFGFHWWRTDFLKDPYLSAAAAKDAVESDVLIVCPTEAGRLPNSVTAWFNGWIDKRQKRDGIMINVIGTGSRSSPPAASEILREIARRGRFDLIPAEPTRSQTHGVESPGANPPRSTNSAEDTSRHPRPPSHFGLNE